MQVDADRTAAAMGEAAPFDGAVFSAAQADQRVGLIVHVPVVLQAGVVLGELIPIAVHKRQALQAQISNRRVLRARLVDVPFDADQLRESGSPNRRIATGPEVELSRRGVQYPLARFVEFLQNVFDPARRGLFQKVQRAVRLSSSTDANGRMFTIQA